MMDASGRSELRLRLISAAVGLPVLLAFVWAGGALFVGAAAAAAALAAREMLALLRAARVRRASASVSPRARAAGAPSSAEKRTEDAPLAKGEGASSSEGEGTDGVPSAAGQEAGSASLSAEGAAGAAPRDWAIAGMGICYVALPFAALILTRLGDAGLQWVALAFLTTFATDTGAYAAGKAMGRRKLAPSVSPGKTWEGAGGGLLAAMGAAAGLVHLLDGVESRVWPALALGLAIGVAAQAGDLLESKLKRIAGAKNSGRLIPGHGGLLDRLDSLVPVFPLVYCASRVW